MSIGARLAGIAKQYTWSGAVADRFGSMATYFSAGYLKGWSRAAVDLSRMMKSGCDLVFAKDGIYLRSTEHLGNGNFFGPNPLSGLLPDKATLPSQLALTPDELINFGRNAREWFMRATDIIPSCKTSERLFDLTDGKSDTHLIPLLLTHVSSGNDFNRFLNVIEGHLGSVLRRSPALRLNMGEYFSNEIVPILMARPSIYTFVGAIDTLYSLEELTKSNGWGLSIAVMSGDPSLPDTQASTIQHIATLSYNIMKGLDPDSLIAASVKRALLPTLLKIPYWRWETAVAKSRTIGSLYEKFRCLNGGANRFGPESEAAYYEKLLPAIILKDDFEAWHAQFLAVMKGNLRPTDQGNARDIEQIVKLVDQSKSLIDFNRQLRLDVWTS